ncbi:MAG: ATP synthase subunit I [Candidatus Omnitrophota bacterium]
MITVIGILIGLLTGGINFFIFGQQMKKFLTTKKWYFLWVGYLIRYTLIGVVFYFSMKGGNRLFVGAIIGFFIAQIIFFTRKARKS